MTIGTSLSKRGYDLATGFSVVDKYKNIIGDRYDPEHNPNGVIDLGTAENHAMLEDAAEFVNKSFNCTKRDLSYGEGPWGSKRLKKAMAKHMTKHFDAIEPVDPEKLIFANGVTSICEMLGYAIGDPGNGVLLSRPIYQAFQIDFGTKAKVQPVYTNFGDVDPFSPAAAQKYEDALLRAEKDGIKVRALMLCNPHNPLGQCYPKDAIIALMKLANKYKIHLLCDEIYATSVYNVPDKKALPFTSVLSFDYSPYISSDYLHVLYGMSKDFAGGGLRLGCIYIQNKELMRAVQAMGQFHWSGGPNERIAITMLEDEKWMDGFIARLQKTLAERNILTRRILEDAGIDYHRGANAGLFLWIDLRKYLPEVEGSNNPWDREDALFQTLVKKKVFITNGQFLGAEEPGWFRVIFSQEEHLLRNGMNRVLEAIGKK